MAFWTFHISLFVNITAMVVNSYTVLYMCMEVIKICQSDSVTVHVCGSYNLKGR